MSLSKTHEIPDNGSMKTKATYPIEYALKRVRDAIDLAEMEGDFQKVRLAVNDLEESIKAENTQLVYEDREMDELERIAEEKDERDTVRSIISSFYPF